MLPSTLRGELESGLTLPASWYSDPEILRFERDAIFRRSWQYAGPLEQVSEPGTYFTCTVGDVPVVVLRDRGGELRGYVNVCRHRGHQVVDGCGKRETLQCPYHAWTYDLEGNLVGIAFERGSHGRGGMPPEFCKADHGPRKLRVATFHGLVFASLSPDTPPLEDYLGEAVRGRIARVLRRPVQVLGRFTQALPNNWKLYIENVKDTYHASLLHAFFTTFRVTRLTQGGGVLVSPDGGHHASTTIDRANDGESGAYREQGLRSDHEGYRLMDPSLLDGVDEFGDGIKLQILTVFPNFVLQQISNCLAVRQVLPKGPGAMELHWTYFGFADDTSEMHARRLKQSNLVGPAGYVSMEDGCVGGFVQRGAMAASDEVSVVNMGGEGTESMDTRATEASVRGFWKAYRRYMGC